MRIWSSLFGKNSVDLKEIVKIGGLIIDVRSPQEYAGGHLKGSINIPLDRIAGQVGELKKKNVPIITCCQSGTRSGMAKSMLKSAGIEAYNGGSWDSLRRKIQAV